MSSSPASSSSNVSPSASDMRIRARGRSFLALILSPEAPLDSWLQELDEQMARSAGFFNGRPIILDLNLINADTDGLETLQQALQERGLFIIGTEGPAPDWPALAHWNLPTTPRGGRASSSFDVSQGNKTTTTPEHEHDASLPQTSNGDTLVIDRVVRSGQSIQHPDGDVVILGAVASGAEIIAGGSIHVYGPLRGRAIAGLDGRSRARIYAQRLEAELLALDGFYMVADEITPSLLGAPAQVLLENETLTIRPLSEERRQNGN